MFSLAKYVYGKSPMLIWGNPPLLLFYTGLAVDLHAGALSTSLKTLLSRIQILERFLRETESGGWHDVLTLEILLCVVGKISVSLSWDFARDDQV